MSLRDLIRHTVQHNVDLEILRLRARVAELQAAHERRLAELLDIGREVVAKDDRITELEALLRRWMTAPWTNTAELRHDTDAALGEQP